MASFTSTEDRKMSAIPLLGFDFGTTKSAVSFSIHGKVELVPLSKARTNRYESAAVVSYDADGHFIHGEALLKLVDSGKVEAVNVLRHFKLLMLHARDSCDECVAFEKLSRKWGKSLDDIIFDYFVALLTQAINHLSKTVYVNTDFSTFDVCLTTPSMWPPAANRLLTQAAKHAGARTSVLYPETLASALCIVQEEILDQPDAVELPFKVMSWHVLDYRS
jgi:molecular chaperone DnaK (HSP70)